jgi:hypothetical protein
MAVESNQNSHWLSVIARALAFVCLHQGELRNKTKGEQAKFLEGLGFARKDAAVMLGTTAASITELMRQAKQGGRRGKKGRKRQG